jgi:RimJ/RimL family protein N-acetyltransferase
VFAMNGGRDDKGRDDRAWRGRRRPGAMAADSGELTLLRGGFRALIRPVRSTDAALLADGFARLSERSRRARFLGNKKTLSSAELRYLTCVDHHDHEALGALDPAGRGVGVARYIRDSEDHRAAELAITIVDEWQGRGLGGKLLELLADRARAEGIVRFTATVMVDNAASNRLILRAGGVLVSQASTTREYEIPLVPWYEQDLIGWLCQLDKGLASASWLTRLFADPLTRRRDCVCGSAPFQRHISAIGDLLVGGAPFLSRA